MPQAKFISNGSTTSIQASVYYGLTIGGIAGGSVIVIDGPAGATPNLGNPSFPSTIARVWPLTAAPYSVPAPAAVEIKNILTISATSNAPVTVYYG